MADHIQTAILMGQPLVKAILRSTATMCSLEIKNVKTTKLAKWESANTLGLCFFNVFLKLFKVGI